MKDNKLTVQINKPVSEVFAFTVNPNNTPLWVDTIVYEESNEWPIKAGSVYRNKNKQGKWSEYDITSFEENKSFVFSLRGSSYHVRYTFKTIPNNNTELEYYEWVDNGELSEPFTLETLQKLKLIIEN